MSSYHERVARAMKASYMAGTMNTYDSILEALHRKFPSEGSLREQAEHYRRVLYAATGIDYVIGEGTMDCAHCKRVVRVEHEGPPHCPDKNCRASVEQL